MEKNIKLTLEQARKLYGKNPEMDELLLANFSKEELGGFPSNWLEIGEISGYFIQTTSEIKYAYRTISHPLNKNLFATEKQAKSALAMAQLSQLIKVYNGDWEPNWTDYSNKYVIDRVNDNIRVYNYDDCYGFLTFKTKELAKQFLENFEPLIKEYFMLD